jgi:pyruvoyl-dependent arginine decarboxylase (PvlArgDC)
MKTKTLDEVVEGDELMLRNMGSRRGRIVKVTSVTPKQIVCEEDLRVRKSDGRVIGTAYLMATVATPADRVSTARFERIIEAQKKLGMIRVTERNLEDTEHFLKTIEAHAEIEKTH